MDPQQHPGGRQSPILQSALPEDQRAAAADPLPRTRPVDGNWITVDDAWAAQVAEKARLLAERPQTVLVRPTPPEAEALHAALLTALTGHPAFEVEGQTVRGPDGTARLLRVGTVMEDAARLLQEDLCLIARQGEAHVLSAALLCFPASWTLAEKIHRPLGAIHGPVRAYDPGIAARVDRLFGGVKEGRPIWRANLLRYADPQLHQPRTEADPRPTGAGDSPYLRSERQTILRLAPDLVLFAIHTTVVKG